MAKYKIEIKKSAQKEIEHLPKKEILRITEAISTLAQNPRPIGSIKLKGEEYYRYRVGKYRIVYEIRDQVLLVIIIRVAHRKEVYK